ncbi:MAG: protein translocase subunit SecD, partial [Candidatus Aminicenantes bacterium]
MRKDLRWKSILVLAVIVLAVFLAYPPGEKIHLGLDLEGGMHLVLEVITEDALSIETSQEILRLEAELKDENLTYTTVSKDGISQFSILEINLDQENEIRDILDEKFRDWDYSIIGNTVSVSLKSGAVNYLRDLSVRQARETIQNRVDELGLAEPTIQRQGTGNRIIVELPGVENPDRIKNIIKTTALLEWRLVLGGPAPDRETLLQDLGGEVPPDAEILRGDPQRTEGGYYLVSKIAPVTGKDLINARRSTDEWNNPAVLFTLNAEAGRRFYDFTSENLNKNLSIILDGKIQEVAVIRDRIPDRGIIHGTYTIEEADDLALILRAGPLPASVRYLEERSIGPSLGKDSIRKGLSAMAIALVLVILFMIFYYRFSGFNAVTALVLNVLILAGILGYLGENAVLTLPGIAGIILTIGMAVDANVLVFERIREELTSGKSVLSSITSGFARAFRTILDANVTTIIAAIFLFQFGTG